jgi:hypothetical protein
MSPLLNGGIATASVPMFFSSGTASPLLNAGITTASVPVYQTYYTTSLVATPTTANVASPLLNSSTPNTASPLLRTASTAPASAPTPADTINEYNRYLQFENALNPGGLFLPASDTTGLPQQFPNLVNKVGLNQLHAFGRFLKTQITDPNFQTKAFNLFGAVLGAAFPQFAPLFNEVQSFLGVINPGTGSGTPPTVNTPPTPNTPVNPNSLANLSFDSGGALRVSVTNLPGTTSPPPVVGATPPVDINALLTMAGAKLLSTDPTTGIKTYQKQDGTPIKFDKEWKPVP